MNGWLIVRFAVALNLMLGAIIAPRAASQRIVLGSQVAEVRALDNGAPVMQLRSGLALPSGRFLLLDGEHRALLTVDADGAPTGRTVYLDGLKARIGNPRQVLLEPDGGVGILDARSGTVTSLVADPSGGWQPNGERSLGLYRVSSSCGLRGRLFALGMSGDSESNTLVHSFTSGSTDHSFGSPFGDPDNIAHTSYADGNLLCLQDQGLVVVASVLYPEIRAYSEEGVLRWSRALSGFRPIRMDRVTERSVRYGYAADSLWDQVVSVFAVGKNLVGVQIEHRRGMSGRHVGLETRLLGAGDGTTVSAQSNLPRIYAVTLRRLVSSAPGSMNGVRVFPYSVTQHE